MRVSPTVLVIVGGLAALVAVIVTNQVLPAADPGAARLRPWLAARAMGITAYLLLALDVGLGLVLAHPRNTAEWRLTKPVFPWHELLTVFVFAFLAMHAALLAVDPYADVGILGTLVPGLSGYRPPAIAVGTIATYALVLTAVSAKWTKLLPAGWWLRIHRLSALTFLLVWTHAVLAGTDSGALLPLYLATGGLILAAVAHRRWTARVRPARREPVAGPHAGAAAGPDARSPRVPIPVAERS
jgi:predicted ferric reductase